MARTARGLVADLIRRQECLVDTAMEEAHVAWDAYREPGAAGQVSGRTLQRAVACLHDETEALSKLRIIYGRMDGPEDADDEEPAEAIQSPPVAQPEDRPRDAPTMPASPTGADTDLNLNV